MLSPDAALEPLEDSSDAENAPTDRSAEPSKEERRAALSKTIETVRARRETLASETSAARRTTNAAAADKAEGGNATALPRAERLAALRDAVDRKRKAPVDDTRRIKFTKDARGAEQLELCGAPAEGATSVVMMAWERPYMEALVEALDVTPRDTVLEVGYGLGFSCAAIQKRRPRRHVVVECDAGVRARMPAQLEVVAATWQAYLSRPFSAAGTVVFDREDDRGYLALDAGPFSAVFFDDFPIVATPSRGSRWRTFLEAVRPLLTKDARIVGYCCDAVRLRKALPDGFDIASFEPYYVTPPDDCPYVATAAGDKCAICVISLEAKANRSREA